MSTAVPTAATPAGAKKTKKSSAPKSKNAPLHPPYFEMITDAIVTLKDRTGSSSQAIAKFVDEKYKNLPANYKKLLSVQLKKNVADGKLVKVKASFKLPSKKSPADASAPAKKPKTAPKPAPKKKAAAKVPAKSKAKSPAKPKAKAAAAKPKPKAKPAAKPKAAVKPKTPTKPAAKSSRTSTRSTPGRTAAAVAKKAPVKKAPAAKKAAAPKKAAAATKKGKK